MKSIIFLTLFMFSTAGNAAGIIVDFEELTPTGDPSSLPGPVISQGFSFSTEAGFIVATPTGSPSQRLFFCPYCTLTFANDSGAAFRLNSLDFMEPGVSESLLTVTGYFAGGGSASISRSASDVSKTFKFDDSWDNLDYVIVTSDSTDGFGRGIDNVVLNAVPIPAAVWLFGSALAGLGWLRRKETT